MPRSDLHPPGALWPRVRLRALAVLAILLAAPVASAQDAEASPTWTATLTLARDTLHVQLVGEGLPAAPVALAGPSPDAQTVIGAQPGPNATWTAHGPRVEVAYDLPLAQGAGFIVLPLRDALLRPMDAAHAGDERVEAEAPAGWGAALAPGADGVVVFGEALRVETRQVGDARVRHAARDAPPAEDWALLTQGLLYLGAQSAPLDDLLFVRAPPEADVADTASATVVVASDAAEPETLARLLARAHQRYRVVEVAPTSGAWLREGEERYHALMALLAADMREPQAVQDEIDASHDENLTGTLPQAPAGSALAREKGLVVVRALDLEIQRASNGTAGMPELLRRLAASDARHDSLSIQRAAEEVANASLAPFFDAYGYGLAWPQPVPVADRAKIWVADLATEPARAMPGEPVAARIAVENRGTEPADEPILVHLDGAEVRAADVKLDVGARATFAVPLPASAPGEHTLVVGPREETFVVLTPARLGLARVSTTPDTPRSGETFQLLAYVENEGQTAGRARVEVREAGALVQRTTETLVDGESTRALTLPLRFEEPGLHVLAIRLVSDDGEGSLVHDVVVQSPEAERETPAPSLALLLLGVLLLAYGRRAR